MNRLTMVRTISWLRREPFVLSKVAVPVDQGPDSGELLTGLAPDQVPRKEGTSELRRSVRYAEAPGRKGTNRPLRMDVHVPNGTGTLSARGLSAGGWLPCRSSVRRSAPAGLCGRRRVRRGIG